MNNIRLLNVQQPWAWALTNGVKDVENRNHHISKRVCDFSQEEGVWVIVVASGNKVTKREYEKLLGKLKEIDSERNWNVPGIKEFESKSVVGLVHFTGSLDECHESIWWDGEPAKAWKISDSFLMENFVKNIRGSQTPMRKLCTHPDFERIDNQLKLQLPDEIYKKMFQNKK